ncbi:helix-turn-helix domain-containing protein [Streptomyces canus]|uniref:helix-turn-helix domain-containing protein n=1 Tax=Streptomyces canus TaxID=58343 RepID=UPI00380DF51D
MLLRLTHAAPPATRTGSSDNAARHPTYERFLDALELHFRELHHVEDHAWLLGCSVRTLSRAARAATGKGAREVIDARRLLEARRLLDHAQWTAHAVAAHLGFTDAADFGRFFRRHTGYARRPPDSAAGTGQVSSRPGPRGTPSLDAAPLHVSRHPHRNALSGTAAARPEQ